MSELDLQRQIDILREEIEAMKRSSTIPRAVEAALRERLGSISPTNRSGPLTSITISGTPVPTATATIEIIANGKSYNVIYQ